LATESQRKRRKSVVRRKKLFKSFNKVMKSGTLLQALKTLTKKGSKKEQSRKERKV
tara:strand:- start:101 stop:268 length:168 start_codon:yes stop_codon:yes gene_type:complete